jgi:hypothetical protein
LQTQETAIITPLQLLTQAPTIVCVALPLSQMPSLLQKLLQYVTDLFWYYLPSNIATYMKKKNVKRNKNDDAVVFTYFVPNNRHYPITFYCLRASIMQKP